jgi:hypothetical protein
MEKISPMKALRAKSAVVLRDGKALILTVRLVGGISVAFPVSRIRGITAARSRSADSIFDVKVQDRGASIAWPNLDIDFSVAEMLPEYLGITTAQAAARRAGSVASPSKAAAARANGTKGGRPTRKQVAA